METLFTTEFDQDLKDSIPHLANYPEMLPFIGKDWHTSKRILLLGESHYLPFDAVQKITGLDFSKNWYLGNSKDLGSHYSNNLRTRSNVDLIENGYREKALAIYSNIRNVLSQLPEVNCSEGVFNKFSFYNYFQKPANDDRAKDKNRSILPDSEDKNKAFETLIQVIKIIKPTTIIFVSKKSFDAFKQVEFIKKESILNDITVDFVPHASRQWWYTKSRSYGNRTGREKFTDLIKNCYSK